MYRLLQSAHEPLDKTWFDKLHALTFVPGEIYNYLYAEYYADKAFHEVIAEHLAALHALRISIQNTEQNDVISRLYLARIDELVDNCNLWLAAANNDGGAFQTANERLYGTPDATIFANVCAWLLAIAHEHAGHELAVLIPDRGGDATALLPNSDTFQQVYDAHFVAGGYMDQLFAGVIVPSTGTIMQSQGDPIVSQVIANIQLAYQLADTSDGFWSVIHSKQQVIRPRGYNMTPEDFTGIIAHEIGSHLLERVNGMQSRLMLLGIGLDHYERGNEGRAMLREQLAAESAEILGWQQAWMLAIMKHIGICLGAGLAGKPYTYTQVLAVQQAAFRLWYRIHALPSSRADAAAQTMTARVLKGTSGRGGAYYKDIVYLEGNIRAWQIATRQPEHILQGDLGKFDIANTSHIADLQRLGVLPTA